jgi:hypothetical protein
MHVHHEFVDIVVDIVDEKKIDLRLPQDGQGLRSRGGHVWPPGLEGPDTFTDTMDVTGPLGPAWKRLCLSPQPGGSTRLSPQSSGDAAWGSGSHFVQVCDSFCRRCLVRLERSDRVCGGVDF